MPDPTAGNVRATGSTKQATAEFFTTEVRNTEKKLKATLGLAEDDELPPYVHQDYPRALYAPDGESVVAETAKDADKLLKQGYFGSLAEMREVEAEADQLEQAAKRSTSGRFVKKSERQEAAQGA